MSPDIFNALFELGGSFVLSLNVIRLYQHKVVKGVHYAPTAFFATWGAWNLYYYPYLEQWYSFMAGILLVTVNIIWLGQVYYYYRKRKSFAEL